jgi:hypothetical protein
MQQQPKMIPLEQTSEVRCECGGSTFSPAIKIRKISRLITGEAQDTIQPVEVFLCIECGEPLEEFLPEALKTKKSKIDLV